MKIKRKLYPNSNDKEFILCSFNDLKFFALNAFYAMKELGTGKENEDGTVTTATTFNYADFVTLALHKKLAEFVLKVPDSHFKNNNKAAKQLDKNVINIMAETALPTV